MHRRRVSSQFLLPSFSLNHTYTAGNLLGIDLKKRFALPGLDVIDGVAVVVVLGSHGNLVVVGRFVGSADV